MSDTTLRDHTHTPPTSQETAMTTTLKTTTDPLGDWFRHIGTKLSDTDYEAGIRAIAWARDQFQPEHMNPERPYRTNADTSRISAEPSDAEIRAAARAVFETRDDPYDDTEWDELTSADRERWKCYARAALVAARKAAHHE